MTEVADFEHAKSQAGELLETYITGAVRLAWTMITQIPPMIATEPKRHEPNLTILEECSEGELVSQQTVSLRPILFFSYEGQVAVEGIVHVITSGWVSTIKSRFEEGRRYVTGPKEMITAKRTFREAPPP